MIAIDPGVSGGLAVTIGLPLRTEAVKMPVTDGDLLLQLNAYKLGGPDRTAYLEDLVKYTGNKIPGSRAAVYGASWGKIYGMLFALGFRIVLVPPQKWQKALGLGTSRGMTKTVWKNKLKQRAEQLYPNLSVTLSTADALLILEAAKRGLLG